MFNILLQNHLMLHTCKKQNKTLLFLKHQYCNPAHFLWSVVIMMQPCQYLYSFLIFFFFIYSHLSHLSDEV